MKTKNAIRGALCFLAGVAATVAVMLSLWGTQEAEAKDAYACIRTALKATGMSGNIPKPEFLITYTVPSCYQRAGYKAEKAYLRGGKIAVKYQK